MKRSRILISCLILCLALTLTLSPSIAETSEQALLDQVYQTVLDRSSSQNTEINFGELTEPENYVSYTIRDYNIWAGETAGMMNVVFYIDVNLSKSFTGEGSLGMCDFDFVLLTRDANATSVDALKHAYPNAVYDLTRAQSQELQWPVVVYTDETLTLALSFEVPDDAIQLGLVCTNIMTTNGANPEAMGNLYTLSIARNPADFNLHNNTSVDVAELYIRAGNGDWSGNLISSNGLSSLQSGKWCYIGVDEDVDDLPASWAIKAIMSDGSTINFSDVDLCKAYDLYFSESASGGDYTLSIDE